MPAGTVVPVSALAAAAWAKLDGHPTLTTYQSVVDPAPPVDDSGTTTGYAVFHPFGGDAGANNLAREPGQLLWQFQVSCAGGDHDYTLWVVDTVRGLFDGKTLTVAGASVGLCQPPPGYQPPAPMPQPVDASSQRLQVPLLYQVLALPS